MKAAGIKRLWLWFAVLVPLALMGGILWIVLPLGEPAGGTPLPDPEPAAAPAPDGPERDPAEPGAAVPALSPAAARAFADSLGIEITAVQLGVNGSSVNVRYRVLDPTMAARLFQPTNRAYLRDSAGRNVSRPNAPVAESLRGLSGQALRAGRVYTYFFSNPGQTIKPGDLVTLVIGNHRAEGLAVR